MEGVLSSGRKEDAGEPAPEDRRTAGVRESEVGAAGRPIAEFFGVDAPRRYPLMTPRIAARLVIPEEGP